MPSTTTMVLLIERACSDLVEPPASVTRTSSRVVVTPSSVTRDHRIRTLREARLTDPARLLAWPGDGGHTKRRGGGWSTG
jgi:hypothetical protein